MLTFLRKIRRSLIEQNSTRKYLLYAIGEIALVVIGILIALQINNWNEERKNEQRTIAYIERLLDDLRADSVMLITHIHDAERKAQYCKTIRAVTDGHQVVEDTSHFIVSLQAVGRLDLPAISDNTFQDLQSSGNLNLIRDISIRESIRKYYNEIPYWWFDQYSTQLVDGYLPIVVDAIPMRIHEAILAFEKEQPESSLFRASEIFKPSLDEYHGCLKYLEDNQAFDFNLKRINRSHLVHAKLLVRMQYSLYDMIELLEGWQVR